MMGQMPRRPKTKTRFERRKCRFRVIDCLDGKTGPNNTYCGNRHSKRYQVCAASLIRILVYLQIYTAKRLINNYIYHKQGLV
jgi:hypothetical protein